MAGPVVFKVGALAVKTLAKPVASRLKDKAQTPGVVQTLCVTYGQFHHNVGSRLSLRLLGHKATKIKPLSEDKAITLGSTIFSEVLVFAVGGALIVIEYTRKGWEDDEKKRVKEEKSAAKRQAQQARFEDLETRLGRMEQQLEASLRRLEQSRTAESPPPATPMKQSWRWW